MLKGARIFRFECKGNGIRLGLQMQLTAKSGMYMYCRMDYW